ncbi:alpha/beta hydrolase [Pseudooceanicola sp.]|uniref:alpha/beta fold hydrolase n=1 Tax=Pseudooceanicola sp. TaxID=1914328 RepID=UPI002602B50C|nr:alpha/beta hydrolase [Pseudooceanicola sp.]MDF1855037.1 alpha/beta hydrolase [Pseudooceanicola sp.]
MFERLTETAGPDSAAAAMATLDWDLMLTAGETDHRVTIRQGAVTEVTPGPFVMPSWQTRIVASDAEWAALLAPVPGPGHHDIIALLRRGVLRFEGDLHPLMANLLYVKKLFESLRETTTHPATEMDTTPRIEPITGRYAHIAVEGVSHRIYWEEAGQGIPLVCLHTAGSDGRQYRAVLNDPEVTRHFRVMVFDMPRHGKSSPAPGTVDQPYTLSSDAYVAQIMAFCAAMELERPVVMGCSIGGRIVLHLAQRHPKAFRALIGLQSSAHVAPYYDTQWLDRADVHGGRVCGAIAYGLMAPQSPEMHRDETRWHYMQGGPGVFRGDMWFYKVDGDFRDEVAKIDTGACPIHLLTGEYDYSCTPQDSTTLANTLGVELTVMKEMGHFPMSENPARFLTYLRPVLDRIRTAG